MLTKGKNNAKMYRLKVIILFLPVARVRLSESELLVVKKINIITSARGTAG